MNILKKGIAVFIALTLVLSLVGCAQGDDELSGFEPVGVRVVESIGGYTYDEVIEDKEFAQQLWDMYLDIDIDTETEAEMGSAYFYMCLYNEDQSTLMVFAIYDNGVCCFEDDNFNTLYTVENGEEVYQDFVECYSNYSSESTENSSK